MLTHRDLLVSRFPKMRPMIEHLSGLGTRAFAIAAMEELIILIIVTCYVLVDGLYSIQIWSALFIAFSIHLFIHLAQAIIIKGYVPGFITSLLLLPYSLYGIHSIWLVTSGIEFFFLSVSGIAFIAINLRFAHWIGSLFGK
ncbi:MAG: HXXEE domain-containing protein [Prevotella sp.]|nr:HXXEE domain-containing protein [Prevotella sp.]